MNSEMVAKIKKMAHNLNDTYHRHSLPQKISLFCNLRLIIPVINKGLW